MGSPITHHRTLATPKSVLRQGAPATGNGRRKSRGFLFFAPPSSAKPRRKVVFNEKVFIQKIVDIRDKSLHWDGVRELEKEGEEERRKEDELIEKLRVEKEEKEVLGAEIVEALEKQVEEENVREKVLETLKIDAAQVPPPPSPAFSRTVSPASSLPHRFGINADKVY